MTTESLALRTAEPTARRYAPLPRDLHPGAWWIWAIAMAATASQTLNPIILAMIIAVVSLVVVSRRSSAPWGIGYKYYLWFGVLIVALRVVYRIIFGGAPATGEPVVLRLPQIPLPELARSIQLLGDVGAYGLIAGLYDGLRLATIIICVGAANSLANPKRLLTSVPPALYEVGTALVVAISVFPQLAESIQRVYRARRLRGEPGGRVARLRRIVVPVLEDALERSMTLAAGMDARGYGRSGTATGVERAATGALLLLGLFGLTIGTYAYLDQTSPRWLAQPMLYAGIAFAALGLVWAGRRVHRTRYRPDRWQLGELVAVLSGLGTVWFISQAAERAPTVVYPSFAEFPQIDLPILAGLLIGVIPAFATPAPAPFAVTDATSGGDT